MALHRGEFGWLVMKGVEAVQVAQEDLQWYQCGQQPQRHRQHVSAFRRGAPAPQMISRHTDHDESCGHEKCGNDVCQPIKKRRVENDSCPVESMKAAIDELVSRRCLHPRVQGEYPEGRKESPHRHHGGREEVSPWRDELAPEEENTQEACLQEESREAFISHEWANDIRGGVREATPVGPELERHNDSRHHAKTEGDRKNLRPEDRNAKKSVILGLQVKSFEHRDVAREPHRECRKQNMERNDPEELEA